MTSPDERLNMLETQLRELREAAGIEPRAAPLGFFQVQPGETILSDHMNSAVLQGVPYFASEAVRASQWPAPHNGAHSVTLDTGTQWRRIAGVWRRWPDMGTFTGTTTAGGQLVVPHSLGVTPLTVLVTIHGSTGGVAQSARIDGMTATNFTAAIRSTSNATVNSTTVLLGWIAYPPSV